MTRKRTYIRLRSKILFLTASITLSQFAYAQGTPTLGEEDLYESRIASAREVKAFDSSLFGDVINLQNGGLSFEMTDIDLPGNNNLPVRVTREFVVRDIAGDNNNFNMQDWRLKIPRIYGTFASEWNASNDPQAPTQARCSSGNGPQITDQINGPHFLIQSVFNGVQLEIPGGPTGEILRTLPATVRPSPESGNPYLWTLDGQTHLRCLPTIQNGLGEGFLAITPDGVRYTFNHMARRTLPQLRGPNVSASPIATATLDRYEISLYVTEVKDRFGNTVTYNYNNSSTQPVRLTSIVASDGRDILIQYQSPTSPLISSITAGEKPDSPGVRRSWGYIYTSGSLSNVRLPSTGTTWNPAIDQQWTYSLSPLASLRMNTVSGDPDGDCLLPQTPNNLGQSRSGTIIHPTGATSTFTVAAELHGRNGVILSCSNVTAPNNVETDDVARYPQHYYLWTLKSKTIGGAGISPQNWSYDYSRDQLEAYVFGATSPSGNPLICQLTPGLGPDQDPCYRAPCQDSNCAKYSYTKVLRPDATIEFFTFGNSWRFNEGKLLKSEIYQNEADFTANPQRPLRETVTYLDFHPGSILGTSYPARFGSSIQDLFQGFSAESVRPVFRARIIQEGQTFETLYAVGRTFLLDSFARPTARSSFGPNGHHVEQISYYDDLTHWVLGQISTINVGSIETYKAKYHSDYAVPTEIARGSVVKSFDYHLVSGVQNGALSSVRDGNGNVTTYNDYRMGVPRDITFQDGHSLRTEIDANGWPLSRRDETLQLTQYRYDVLGRLKEIDVDGPWNSTIFSFNKLAASGAPYGLNSHWLRTTQIGGMRTDVYLDALLRPVRTEKVDLSAQLPRRVTLSRFDVMNRRNFESYPVSGLAIPTGNEEGSFWTFDALNRERTISQDRENNAPAAVTSIDYLTGFRKRVTNPRGFVTEYEFQAFADPDQALPIRISAPEGQTTVISRDDFGNATSISRTSVYGGTPYTLTRSFVYDSSQRLCKRIEPETGVSVFSYDSAGNLDWSAHGLSLTSTSDCSRESVQVSDQIKRLYDERNRLEQINYPDATPPTIYDYYADGTVKTATRDGSVWTFTYNELKLRETETLANSQGSWTFDPDYRLDGALQSLAYPGEAATTFNPNAFGEPTQVGAFASNATYHADGSLAAANYGNGIEMARQVNLRYLPSDLRFTRPSAGETVFSSTLTYDANANVLTILGSQPNTFVYDQLDRLEGSTRTLGSNTTDSWSFVYDPLDNLRTSVNQVLVSGVQQSRRELNFDLSNGRLGSVRLNNGPSPILSYQYDTRGNTTGTVIPTVPATVYPAAYDRSEMLVSVSNSSVSEQFRYDAYGHRVWKRSTSTTGTIESSHVYTPDGQLRMDVVAGGDITRYYYLGNQLIAQRTQSGNSEWYISDHLGSNVGRRASSGLAVGGTSSSYSPYGERSISSTGPGFTGHYEDASSLTYMKARYYGGITGRFISPDPVQVDTSTGANFNRYWYANNNPMKYVDPDGRFVNFAIGFAVGFVLDASIQYYRTGDVNIKQSLVSGAAGALTGGVGGALTRAAAVEGAITGTTATLATGATGVVAGGLATAATATVTGQELTGTQLVIGSVVGGATAGLGAGLTNVGASTTGTLARISTAPINSPAGIGVHIADTTAPIVSSSATATVQGAAAGTRTVIVEGAGKITDVNLNGITEDQR